MLVLHVPNALQHAAADGIAQVLGCRLGVDIAQVDRPVHSLNTAHAVCHITGIHHVNGVKRSASVLCERREGCLLRRHCLLSNKGLSSSGLGLLSGRLLRLRDISAPVLAIIDALASPGRFRRQSVNDLRKGGDQKFVLGNTRNRPTLVATEMLKK
jgi:hypothetical protein